MPPKTDNDPPIPASVQPVHDAIVALTDAFCREHLNAEYEALCRKLAGVLARKRPSPLFRSRPHIWACVIVRVIGEVNFLDDNSQAPHLPLTEIDREFGVSPATVQARSGQVRATFKIRPDDPQWTLPSRLAASLQALWSARQGQTQQRSRMMAKAKSPFTGRWRIESMSAWDQDFIDEEEEGYFEFDDKGGGEFHFGYVHGQMDCRLSTREGKPAAGWTWDGNDKMDPAQGRGWAVVKGDELHGTIFFHQGDDSEFVGRKVKP